MKIKRCLLSLLFVFSGIAQINAQSLGCLIGNSVYTQPNGTLNVTIVVTVNVRNFDNPSLSTFPNACPRATNVVPVTGALGITTCVANGNILPLGTTITYTRLDPPVQCNLDDYAFPLAAAAAALGLLTIRKRRIN